MEKTVQLCRVNDGAILSSTVDSEIIGDIQVSRCGGILTLISNGKCVGACREGNGVGAWCLVRAYDGVAD